MEIQGWISVATVAAAALLFVLRLAPPEVIALAIPVVLALTGVLDPGAALQGFGNQAVIALGAIFVVGAGLQGSGLAGVIARAILRLSGTSEKKILFFLMLAVATVSGFMSNAAAVALFLPTAVALSRRAMISPARILLPMASAAVLGGTLTLVGSAPNLLVSGYLQDRTGVGLGVLEFATVGVPIVVIGILFTIVIGRRFLPQRSSEDRLREALLPEELAESYGLTRNLSRMRLLERSGIVGKSIAEAAIRRRYGVSVVLIMRPTNLGRRYLDPKPDLVLEAGDQLYIDGDDRSSWQLAEEETLQFALAGPQSIERILGQGQMLAEVSVSPRSSVFGQTLKDLGFRSRYGLNALSLWRRGAPIEQPADIPLELGDAFLVSGPAKKIAKLAEDPDYLVLTDQSTAVDVRRAPIALALLMVAILPPILGVLPLAVSAVASALLMVITGCVPIEGARRSIEWKVIFLIVGTLPLGAALETTGVASAIATGMLHATSPLGDSAILAGIFFLAAVVAVSSSNSAAAVIIAPIAAQAAASGEIGLEKALLAVAYGSSCAFVLPMAQWNLLVMGPGGYRTADFIRFGAFLSVVMGITAIVMLSIS